ncbi:carbohydrate phosphatase [Xylariaceae sp. FL1272]|nr:carbohydrate phosphatase [Xylariaceae sp. FL1272]
MDSPYSHELQIAIRAVQSAAKISQSVLTTSDKGTVKKDDASPVTIADFAIQALLTTTIHYAFPNDTFVGEESSAELKEDPVLLNRVWELLHRVENDETLFYKLPDSPEHMCEMIDKCGFGEPGGSTAGRVWVFDPIDGTKTFVERQACECLILDAINVALLEGSKQVLSVVGCPTLNLVEAGGSIHNSTVDATGRGSIAFAVKGHGTYVRPLIEPPNGIVIRKIVPQHSASTTAAELRPVSCYDMLDSGVDDAHQAIMKRLGADDKGCDFLAWVLRWVMLAGAMLLFEEIGGKITDVDGKDIDLGVGRLMTENHGFVAAPKSVHAIVLKTVHDVLHEQEKQHLLAQTGQ